MSETYQRPAWLDKTYNATRNLLDIAEELRYLARAFAVTGNRELATDLHAWADVITKSAKECSEAMSENIHDGLRDAEKATGNMMLAFLAGITKNADPATLEAVQTIAPALRDPK